MNAKPYRWAIVIGRMGPPHLGHIHLIKHALTIADKVLVLIGSAFRPRDVKNPFEIPEIARMISLSFPQTCRGKLVFKGLRDFKYNDNAWIEEVQRLVGETLGPVIQHSTRVALVGHSKDESSYYLKVFPKYDHIDPGEYNPGQVKLSSTKIRELLFTGHVDFVEAVVNPAVFRYLKAWVGSKAYKILKAEYDFIQEYKAKWSGSPYPPVFVTTDAVIIQSGHLLLVKRNNFPGKGLWALPGGYLGINETLRQSCLRELYEETKIKMVEAVLSRNLVEEKNFDHPDRSLRGRVVTTAFHFRLDDQEKLPRVKGGDDAAEAAWFPIAEVRDKMSPVLFEDHWDIATYFINR